MKEIKFRGKRLDNGEWAYGFLYRHDPPLQCFSNEGKELPSFAILKTGFADWSMPRPIEQHEVDGKTVGEFTNIKDKNGKEIYDGDRVKRREHLVDGKDYIDWFFEVRWVKWCYCLFIADKQIRPLDPIEGRECEVVGSIYDKPSSEQNDERSVATKADQGTEAGKQ